MPRGWFSRERYYDADDDGGPGGGEPEAGKVRATDLRAALGAQPDEQALMRLLEKHAEVLTDNAQLRAQRRTLKQEKAALEAKATPEGARVLSPDEARAYDAYVALGAPDALKATLDASQGATAELASLRRAERIRAAADAAGFKPSVLAQLAGDLDIQTKPTKEGKPLAVVMDGEKETALADYAKAHWADFLPALTPAAREAPDINANARGNGSAPLITDEDRERAKRLYRATF